MVSKTWDRLLLACLLSLTLCVASAHAQPFEGSASPDSTFGDGDTFAQPLDDAAPTDSQVDEFYDLDDTASPESYAPESYAPQDDAPIDDEYEPDFEGDYSESDFTDDYAEFDMGLEEAYVPEHNAPKYWLPEVHHNGDGSDAYRDPWFTQVEFVMMHRNRARRTLTTLETRLFDFGGAELVPIEIPLMDTKDGTFQMEPGVRVTVGRYLGKDYIGRDHTLEFTYLGVPKWNANRSQMGGRLGPVVIGPNVFEFGSLNSPFSQNGQSIGSFAGGFSNADTHSYQSRSELHNFEVNWRVRRGERRGALVVAPDGSWNEDYTPSLTPSLLFGLRYLDFDDEFSWTSRGVIKEDGVDVPFSGQYDVETSNILLGLQTGVEIRHQWRRFSWSVQTKVGLYGTSLDQNSAILIDDNTLLHSLDYPTESQFFGDDTIDVGFIGELGFLFRYRLSPHCTLRGGYDFNWVHGLALAAEQITYSNPPNVGVNQSGHLLFQGARFGLECVW